MIDFSIIMKTATVADLRNNFRRISSWIEHGQTVSITRHGHAFAELVPKSTAEKPFKMPDFEAQRKKIWGDRPTFTAEQVREMREFELKGEGRDECFC